MMDTRKDSEQSDKKSPDMKRLDKKGQDRNRPSFRARLKYRFDNIMARGTLAKVILLLIFSLFVIFLLGIILYLIGGAVDHPEFSSSVWISLMHTFDPGTLGGDEDTIPVLAILLIATLFGMFFTATLIGIINNGLEGKMDQLAKGRSKVLESNHTIILGFNHITFEIIQQLMEANENQPGRQVIVVMDQDTDKTEMEESIRLHLSPDYMDAYGDTADWKARGIRYRKMLRHTRIVCRKGHVYSARDLAMCSIETCRSIIINASDDAHTMKAIMACSAAIDKMGGSRRKLPYITAVVRDKNQMDTAVIAGRDNLEVVCYEDVMSRIIANASRRPGMSYVFTELFNYDNNEIYCVPKSGIGLPDGVDIDSLSIYELNQYMKDCIVVGGIRRDEQVESSLAERIWHPLAHMKSCLAPTIEEPTVENFDKLYVMEEDDDPIQTVERQTDLPTVFSQCTMEIRQSGHLVIVGAGPLVEDVLNEVDGFLQENTEVTILDSDENLDRIRGIRLNGLKITLHGTNLDDYESLRNAIPDDIASALVLAENSVGFGPDADDQDKMELSDEKILARLLFLRQIRQDIGHYFNITCEMNIDQNRKLAEYTNHEDFIVGSSITAMIITQIAQTRELNRAFHELLDADGSELYMRRAGDVLDIGEAKSFDIYTLQALMAQRNEVFLGIRKCIDAAQHEYEIPVINPPKWTRDGDAGRERLIQYEIQPEDVLVVIASQ